MKLAASSGQTVGQKIAGLGFALFVVASVFAAFQVNVPVGLMVIGFWLVIVGCLAL